MLLKNDNNKMLKKFLKQNPKTGSTIGSFW